MRSAIRSSNRQAWPTRRTSASRGTGFAEAKIAASTRSIHSRQRAAGGRSRSSTSSGFVALSSSAAGRGAHRPYSRNVGRPENSRAAPSTTRRSNRRRAARPVIGAWRAASAGETQSWASRRSTIFWAGFERSLGAMAIRVLERRAEIGGEVEGGGGGERDRACGGVWPGGVAWLGPSSGARQAQRRIQDFRSDQRHGPRPAQPDGDDAIEHPKRQNLGWGRWGVREGGEGQGGGLCGRRNRIALPCASLQACCKAVGVHGQVQPRRCVKDPAWVEAGRPAGAVAPERQEVCRGSERVADREAEVAQRGGVGVEAQDFGARPRRSAARGRARKRPGGGRIGAQKCVEQSEPGPGGKQRLALPCPSGRPRPGWDRRRRWKGLVLRGFR